MLDHAITIRDVVFGSGMVVGVVLVAVVIYVIIQWIRMRRDYRDALSDRNDD